jgi:hypothetical protein
MQIRAIPGASGHISIGYPIASRWRAIQDYFSPNSAPVPTDYQGEPGILQEFERPPFWRSQGALGRAGSGCATLVSKLLIVSAPLLLLSALRGHCHHCRHLSRQQQILPADVGRSDRDDVPIDRHQAEQSLRRQISGAADHKKSPANRAGLCLSRLTQTTRQNSIVDADATYLAFAMRLSNGL